MAVRTRAEIALQNAISSSYRSLEGWRKSYRDLVADFIGQVATRNADVQITKKDRKQVIALMRQTAEAYMTALVPNRPRATFSTRDSAFVPFARRFELNFNSHMERIRAEEELQDAVLSAFFVMGVIKSGFMESPYVIDDGEEQHIMVYPQIRSISMDSFIFDRAARDFRQVQFAADGYRVPFDSLKGDDRFNQGVIAKLKPTSKYNRQRADGDSALSSLTQDLSIDADEVVPGIDLLDVWLPLEGVVRTYALSAPMAVIGEMTAIGDSEWVGSEWGPYDYLTFARAPENMLVGGPATHLRMLADLVNSLLRKQARRAKESKIVNTFTPGADADADTIRTAGDMEWKKVKDVNSVKPFIVPGADAATQNIAMQFIQLFDRAAGNLPSRAGLGVSAPTAHQEQLIHDQVSKQEGFLSNRVVNFVHRVFGNQAELMWNDETTYIANEYEVPNTSIRVQYDWSPDLRHGRFSDYRLAIDPYSMQFRSPTETWGQVMAMLRDIVLPTANIWSAQGGTLDCRELFDVAADLLNLPVLRRIISFKSSPVGPAAGGQDGPAQPGSSQPRVYSRSPRQSPNVDPAQLAAMLQQQGAPNEQQQAGFQP